MITTSHDYLRQQFLDNIAQQEYRNSVRFLRTVVIVFFTGVFAGAVGLYLGLR